MRVRVLDAGPDARRTLAVDRTGTVAHVLSGGAYLHLDGDRWLFLGHPRTPMGPLSLRLNHALTEIHPDDPVTFAAGLLKIGRAEVGVKSWCQAPAFNPTSFTGNQRLALSMNLLPVPERALGPGLDALRADDVTRAVALLAGRGEGLTPAGDDVLAGFAAWRAAVGRPSAGLSTLAAGRSSPLGLAYLRCAEQGEVAEPVERYLEAALSGDQARSERAAHGLRTWGASSGAAMAWGMLAAAAGANPAAAAAALSRG